jgi:hypothetical protein
VEGFQNARKIARSEGIYLSLREMSVSITVANATTHQRDAGAIHKDASRQISIISALEEFEAVDHHVLEIRNHLPKVNAQVSDLMGSYEGLYNLFPRLLNFQACRIMCKVTVDACYNGCNGRCDIKVVWTVHGGQGAYTYECL